MSLLKSNSLILAIFCTLIIGVLSLTRIGTQQPISFKYLDKIEHCIAYSVLSFLWLLAIGKTKSIVFLVVLGCVFYGIIIEVLQGATTYRTFDYVDMVANSLGVIVGYLVLLFLGEENIVNE